MREWKRAALIDVLCGEGKNSAEAARPILTAAGIEVCDARACGLPDQAEQWKKTGVEFDAIVCGFPGSEEESRRLSAFLRAFRRKDTVVLCLPAENGWEGRNEGTAEKEERRALLCPDADVAVLPVGEAAAWAGERDRRGPWSRAKVERLLRGVCAKGAKNAVATGVWFSPDLMGAAVYSAGSGNVSYAFSHQIAGAWPDSGNLFGAALLAGLLRGLRLNRAAQLAVDSAADEVRRAQAAGDDLRAEPVVRAYLPGLLGRLGAPRRYA